MHLFKPLFAASALLFCACVPKLYTPVDVKLSDPDALHLAEISLAEELKAPIAPAGNDPHVFYVRIGDRPAPKALLARLTPQPRFELRSDPIDKPKDGSCLQVNIAPGDGEHVDVSVVYGHSHPHSIQVDMQGTTFAYRRQGAEWVLVQRGRWAT
jgi:hypothetical protein